MSYSVDDYFGTNSRRGQWTTFGNRVPTITESSYRQVFTRTPSLSPREIKTSPWLEQVTNELLDVSRLPLGWDGGSGRSTSIGAVEAAHWLLSRPAFHHWPAPAIVPRSDGSLQIEWHKSTVDLEIEIDGRGRVQLYIWVCDGDEELEYEGSTAGANDAMLAAMDHLLA